MDPPPASARRTAGETFLVLLLAATIFISAFLLFQVQPLISKLLLPWFGGSPAVWTTAMLFFQCVLFGGYCYAHLVSRWLTLRGQTWLHLGLLVAAALAAHSILPSEHWRPHGEEDPTLRILLLLSVSVGLPYFCLATTGPLIQSWFGQAFPGQSPYRLYSLSNVGSFLALLSFPYWFEPRYDLPELGGSWSLGFWLFAATCGTTALQMLRCGGAERPGGEATGESAVSADPGPAWFQRAAWVGLPALASLMFIATTDHVSHDVAPEPRLWISTLALYLLTFIICFEHPRWYRRGATALATILGIALLSSHGELADLTGLDWEPSLGVSRWSHYVVMFAICLLCHGELVRLRPASSRQLTEFYLCVSLGGACGGLFVTLIATPWFNDYYEWTLGLLAALLLAATVFIDALRAARPEPLRQARRYLLATGGVGTLLCGLVVYCEDPCGWRSFGAADCVTRVLDEQRSFYGVVSVEERHYPATPERDCRMFNSGIVRHGMQFLDPDRRRLPTAYYATDSGVGETLAYAMARQPSLRVAVVGLGVGTIATYARPTDTYDFFEINPAVVRLAREHFTFLPECRAGEQRVILGDARLKLAELPADTRYDVLVLDAFSGDSIPVHLLTQEAFALYRRRLAPRGFIAINITNSYLNLYPQVKRQAEHLGLPYRSKDTDGDFQRLVYHNHYFVLADDPQYLAQYPTVFPRRPADSGQGEVPFDPDLPGIRLWTDHFSSINALQLDH